MKVRGVKNPEDKLGLFQEDQNTETTYTVDHTSNSLSSAIIIQQLRPDLKLKNLLVQIALAYGLHRYLANPNPATAIQQLTEFFDKYHDLPFSQSGLETFLENQTKCDVINLPIPVSYLPRSGQTCRSIARDLFHEYILSLRDKNNLQVPQRKTLEIALQLTIAFVKANGASTTIPVNIQSNIEINRAIKLICEVMKCQLPDNGLNTIFNYHATRKFLQLLP